ncbi:unnamed protein product [Caenorhabditis nigoni]
MKSGTISWADMLNDFLGLDSEISLHVLRDEKWEEFETIMNKLIVSEDVRECGANKSCINMSVVSSGIQKLEEMDGFSLKDMDTLLKTFQPLADLKKLYDDTQKSISSMGVIIKQIKMIPKLGANGDLLAVIKYKRRLIYKSSVQLLTLARSFAGGVRVLRDLVSAKESGNTIKMIVDSFDVIAEEIGKLDIRQSYKIRRFWTPKIKKSLQEIASNIKDVEESIRDRPHRIADFKKIFNSTRSIDIPNLNSLEMMRQLSFLKKPDDIREALDTFDSLNLDFSSAATKLDVSITALSGIQIVLGDFFKINKPVITSNELDQTTTEPEHTISWVIIGGCLFALLILIGASVGGCFFWKKHSAKKEKEAAQNAQHADFLKEREQQLKQVANATNANNGVNPTEVTKPAKNAPGKKVPPTSATPGKGKKE